MGLIKVGILTI